MLRAIPKVQEVKDALFSLLVDKTPRPDGFPTFFFLDLLGGGYGKCGEGYSRIFWS